MWVESPRDWIPEAPYAFLLWFSTISHPYSSTLCYSQSVRRAIFYLPSDDHGVRSWPDGFVSPSWFVNRKLHVSIGGYGHLAWYNILARVGEGKAVSNL